MKINYYYILILGFAVLLIACTSKKQESEKETVTIKEESYLGQKPPGLTPKLFLPGIVTTEGLEGEAAFTPSMDEFYFLRQKKGEKVKNYVTKYKDGVWQEPEELETSERGEIFISSDNKTMHLGSNYRERTDLGWSDEKSLGFLFKDLPIMRLTVSNSGTYYFDVQEKIGNIQYSRLIDGKREKPKSIGEIFNAGTWSAHPFIAPDESYLIWDSEREDGYGDVDLYISFKQEDGTWGPAINLGENINTEFEDIYGSVSPDGKYFFFQTIDLNETNPSCNIYWVDAQFIENLREIQ